MHDGIAAGSRSTWVSCSQLHWAGPLVLVCQLIIGCADASRPQKPFLFYHCIQFHTPVVDGINVSPFSGVSRTAKTLLGRIATPAFAGHLRGPSTAHDTSNLPWPAWNDLIPWSSPLPALSGHPTFLFSAGFLRFGPSPLSEPAPVASLS